MTCLHSDSVQKDKVSVPAEEWTLSQLDSENPVALATAKPFKIEEKPNASSDLLRLKGTHLGRLYIKYIKTIPPLHHLFVRVWRALYPKYTKYLAVFFLRPELKKWRPLISLKQYVEKNNLPTVNVLDESSLAAPAPRVFPAADQAYLSLQQNREKNFPKVYVAQISDAVIYGGTNLIFIKDDVVHHDLYDFKRDYTSEELNGRHVIDSKRHRIRLLLNDSEPIRLTVAACFVDACAPNYAHWLTEVLTRVAAFCSLEQYAHVPLIVDDGLHANIMQSLYVIGGASRQIIVLPIGRAIKVDTLLATSVAGYVPFERRNRHLDGHSHGAFSALALQLLRTRVFDYADKVSLERFPAKIYLERGQSYRSVTNENQIMASLTKLGFHSVRLETISFIQQVAIFKHAKVVVGPTGAALANLIFSDSDQSIHILIAKHPEMSYLYWPSMTSMNGPHINYILGVAPNLTQGIHSNFHIELEHIFQSMHSTQGS
jgi:capsular polysaccharide biosynthesis protein